MQNIIMLFLLFRSLADALGALQSCVCTTLPLSDVNTNTIGEGELWHVYAAIGKRPESGSVRAPQLRR